MSAVVFGAVAATIGGFLWALCVVLDVRRVSCGRSSAWQLHVAGLGSLGLGLLLALVAMPSFLVYLGILVLVGGPSCWIAARAVLDGRYFLGGLLVVAAGCVCFGLLEWLC